MTLMQLLNTGSIMLESKAAAWMGHVVCRSLRLLYNQAAGLTSIKYVSHLSAGGIVRLYIRFIRLHQLYVIYLLKEFSSGWRLTTLINFYLEGEER